MPHRIEIELEGIFKGYHFNINPTYRTLAIQQTNGNYTLLQRTNSSEYVIIDFRPSDIVNRAITLYYASTQNNTNSITSS
jgi:hypothetical protein